MEVVVVVVIIVVVVVLDGDMEKMGDGEGIPNTSLLHY